MFSEFRLYAAASAFSVLSICLSSRSASFPTYRHLFWVTSGLIWPSKVKCRFLHVAGSILYWILEGISCQWNTLRQRRMLGIITHSVVFFIIFWVRVLVLPLGASVTPLLIWQPRIEPDLFYRVHDGWLEGVIENFASHITYSWGTMFLFRRVAHLAGL